MLRALVSQPVTGMDTCIRKPLLATCSMDMSVRIWNIKDMGCELVRLQLLFRTLRFGSYFWLAVVMIFVSEVLRFVGKLRVLSAHFCMFMH